MNIPPIIGWTIFLTFYGAVAVVMYKYIMPFLIAENQSYWCKPAYVYPYFVPRLRLKIASGAFAVLWPIMLCGGLVMKVYEDIMKWISRMAG